MSSFDWVTDMASFRWVADMAWCHVENKNEYPKAPFLLSAPVAVTVSNVK